MSEMTPDALYVGDRIVLSNVVLGDRVPDDFKLV